MIVRFDKEKHDETLAEPKVKPFDVTGKAMKGWALVTPAGIKADDNLISWVRRSAKYAASLPLK